MPFSIKYVGGEPRIAITSFGPDEIRSLAPAEIQGIEVGSAGPSRRGIDHTWNAAPKQELQNSADPHIPHELIRGLGMEIETLRQELAAERRCTAAYQSRLAQIASQKAAPGGWLWWPLLVLAGVGIVDVARFIAGLAGWR